MAAMSVHSKKLFSGPYYTLALLENLLQEIKNIKLFCHTGFSFSFARFYKGKNLEKPVIDRKNNNE